MKTSYISTATLLNGPRSTIGRVQADLNKATIETDGRYADVGLALGYKTGISLDLHHHLTDLDAQHERNGLTTARLANTQNALDRVRLDGEAFLALVAPGKLSDSSANAVAQTAASKLSAFIAQMNATGSGQYLFAGINTGQAPMADYQASPPNAAKKAFTTAFTDAFGFPPGTQPDAANITAAQMQTFIDGPFAALFADPRWKQTWSTASDVNVRSEVEHNEIVETSTNANSQAVRQLAMLYVLGSEIGLSTLSTPAQNAVYAKLRSIASSATLGMTQIQADLGITQSRIETVEKQRDVQKNIATEGLRSLEGVDTAEAMTRVSRLQTQLGIAYSLTGQITKLSLLDYVR